MGKPTIIETREDGRTFGWLGVTCPRCKGSGQESEDWRGSSKGCGGCGGTGEAYGEIKPDAAVTTTPTTRN